jgi:ABC-type Mn2+/Zn2+ transport system ATPase subunit
MSHIPERLEVQDASIGYGDKIVLRDLTFTVPHGARVAVVGPNGAGKSTLFKALVGLLPLRSGRIFVHGLPLGNHKDCVAYVPQREEVDWRFPVTVADVVMMGRYGRLGWLRRPTSHDREVVIRSLEHLAIRDLGDAAIGELSGGQQQRAFLARALAQEPHILLMDEPFTGIDISTQEATLGLLDRLQGEGVTAMVSTHDLNMAAKYFDQVVLINRRLIASGPSDQVFTPDNIREAFGTRVLFLGGAAVVDECCPPDEEELE